MKLAEINAIKTLDYVCLNYEGQTTSNLFACTITSRKKYKSLHEFRDELYQFLHDVEYRYCIQGFMEYHEQKGREDKVHAHCVLYYGNPPKGNKNNPFTFKVTRLDNVTIWDNYCKKNIMETLEREHNIKTGIFNYHKKPTILFD